MAHDTELDVILSALARPEMAGISDRLLDLRESAFPFPSSFPSSFPSAQAGQCVKIYFELLAWAPASKVLDQPLAALRGWLEKHLSIEVLDDARMVPLERLPLRFQGEPDLDTFCRAAMKYFFNDRCHSAPRIRMQFGFAETS